MQSNEVRMWKYQALLDSLIMVERSELDSTREHFIRNGPYAVDRLNPEAWERTGLSKMDAQRLHNYIKAGGRVVDASSFSELHIGDSTWLVGIDTALIYQQPWSSEGSSSRWDTYPTYWEGLLSDSLDINSPDSSILVASGVPGYFTSRWKRYLSTGASFRRVEDLLSLYGIDSTWYRRNSSWMITKGTKANLPLWINKVQEEELISEHHLPTWQAKRVVEYRDRLGGFVRREQIFECVRDSIIAHRLMNRISIDGQVRRIDLNAQSVEELASHPYIGWTAAKSIEYYRSRVRPIEDIADLIGLEGIGEEEVRRLSDYIQ